MRWPFEIPLSEVGVDDGIEEKIDSLVVRQSFLQRHMVTYTLGIRQEPSREPLSGGFIFPNDTHPHEVTSTTRDTTKNILIESEQIALTQTNLADKPNSLLSSAQIEKQRHYVQNS